MNQLLFKEGLLYTNIELKYKDKVINYKGCYN
mgnify:FL=1|jgi:hypothetical protein